MFYNFLKTLTNYLSTDIPPGPKILKLKHVINLQKGGTFFYVLSLMNYFKNYNKTAYLYLSLHGTYGLIWLIKDAVIPDKGWERKSTILSSIATFLLVLGPYWVSPYLIIKNKVNISNVRSALCIFTHTLGCVIMMASDTQKYFQLENGKKLINDGWFKKSRNINYLSEMMIYSSYAMLGNSKIPYYILFYIWSVLFIPNMLSKDQRIMKKVGGKEYIKKSSLLFPF